MRRKEFVQTKIESIETKLETICRHLESATMSAADVIAELRRQIAILEQLNGMFDLESSE